MTTELLVLLACTEPATDGPARSAPDSPADSEAPGDSPLDSEPPATEERIAFRSMRSGNGDIYWMLPDGSGQTRLTQAETMELQPAISPDRSRVAYAVAMEGRIEAVELATLEIEVLAEAPMAGSPTWSPDGSELAFSAEVQGVNRLFVVELSSGESRQLLEGASVTEPHWSPDGTQFVFTQPTEGTARDLFVWDREQDELHRLTEDGHDDWGPAFRTDGQSVVFQSTREGSIDLFEVPIAGGEVKRLTDTQNEEAATFSPDGTQMAWRSWAGEHAEIVVGDAQGGEPLAVSADPADDFEPDWR